MVEFLIAPETVHVESSATGCSSFKHGVWGRSATAGAQVAIKELNARDDKDQQWLVKVAEASAKIRHPHLLHVYGASCQGDSSVLLCEHGVRSNLRQFFTGGANRDVFWKIFYQASIGLLYLETKSVAHGDLQCSNIFVGADGKAKIWSDFHLPCNRRDSKTPRPSSLRFPTPAVQCVDFGFPSAVFSLGICILEAWTGDSEEAVAMTVRAGNTQSRPNDMSKHAWELVGKMCHSTPSHRPTMADVSAGLRKLMKMDMKWRGMSICNNCSSVISLTDNYCASCGVKTKATAANAFSSQPEDRQCMLSLNEDGVCATNMMLASHIDCDCSKCASKVSSSHNFCGSCGAKQQV